jgi:carbon monoxide dehydrogenase subunit G
MQIQNRFEVPMPPADAWIFLMNIPTTVACFPGAELVETIDDDNYKGRITVKLGPLTMVFLGKLRIEERDEGAHSAAVKANWTEAKGRGNAVTVTRFSMQAHGSGTLVQVDSDVQLAGQVAQYGRASGMISEISAQLIEKFALNLRATIDEIALDPKDTEISGLTLASRALFKRLKRADT